MGKFQSPPPQSSPSIGGGRIWKLNYSRARNDPSSFFELRRGGQERLDSGSSLLFHPPLNPLPSKEGKNKERILLLGSARNDGER